MKVLIVHPNFPGQYKYIAKALAENPQNQVIAACRFDTKKEIPGVKKILYKSNREPSEETHSYVRGFEQSVILGQALWKVCLKLKESNFIPNIILGHMGWGDGLFLKDIFPDSPILSYMEFYYHAFGADMHFDPNEKVEPDNVVRTRVRNAVNLLNLECCDWAISPTIWQKSLHPKEFQHKITVLHEGIDTDLLKPHKGDNLILPDGIKLRYGDEIITYVARNFEPYRGFPTAMKAFEIILKQRPNAHILIIGADGVSYGKKSSSGKTYKEIMLEEVTLDQKRTHWLGTLSFNEYTKVLQYSAAHIYLTVPFVLSWSLLEAMSIGCPVICSDTAPLKEVIENKKNGLMVDFFSPEDVAGKVSIMLDGKENTARMRKTARETIQHRFDLKKLLPLHLNLIKDIADKRIPPTTAGKI